MVKDIRFIDLALGKVNYEISASAVSNLRGRSSLYVYSPIKAGELLTRSNIKAVRPSFGLHPKHYKEILGRTAKRDLVIGERLSWELIG